ncbi:MAG: hypothetical protein ACI4YB_01925 [Oscillospiraceae bacterium]
MENNNNHDLIALSRRIFSSYNRMKLEINTLSRSIDFYSKHKADEIQKDIHSMSVSHPSENSGGSNPNVSANKLPSIVEQSDKLSDEYDSQISEMRFRRNVYIHAVESVDSFVSFLPEERSSIIKWLYISKERKTYGEISAEINLSERRIKQIVNNVLLEYANTLNYDIELIINNL